MELLQKVETLLKALEFCLFEGDDCSVCPSCRRCMYRHLGEEGHEKDCELAAVLIEVQKEVGRPRESVKR
jgi:hypothetical protein